MASMSASGSSTLLDALQDEDFGWRLRIITEGEVGLGWFIGAVIRVLTPQFWPQMFDDTSRARTS